MGLAMKRLLLVTALMLCAPYAMAQSAVPANGYPPPNLSTVNSSATIVTGGAFQSVMSAVGTGRSRRSLTIQNNNSADTCWVFVGSGTASAAKSIALAPGQAYTRYFPYVPNDQIQATCATTSDTLYVDHQ